MGGVLADIRAMKDRKSRNVIPISIFNVQISLLGSSAPEWQLPSICNKHFVEVFHQKGNLRFGLRRDYTAYTHFEAREKLKDMIAALALVGLASMSVAVLALVISLIHTNHNLRMQNEALLGAV